MRTVFMVRPHDPGPAVVAYYRRIGCDATKFYIIQNDIRVMCEHEVFTD